jgi:hypothetical protein
LRDAAFRRGTLSQTEGCIFLSSLVATSAQLGAARGQNRLLSVVELLIAVGLTVETTAVLWQNFPKQLMSLRFPAGLIFHLTVLISLWASFDTVAQSRTKVQWAGVSLAGQDGQLPRLMPATFGLMTPEFQKRLDRRVAQVVKELDASHPSMTFLVDEQMLQGDDSYALTFALAGESITSVTMEDKEYADFVLQALVLIANVSKDPNKQRVVASYPIQVRRTVLIPDGRKPTVEDGRQVFAELLMGIGGKIDLVAEWRDRLRDIRLREREVWISVGPLKIPPEVQVQAGFKKDLADATTFKVSSVIESNISRSANIPIVPGSLDSALDNLSLSFADRPVAFRKPAPSYLLDVSVYILASSSGEEAMTRERKFVTAFVGGFQVDYSSVEEDPDRKLTNLLSLRLQKQGLISYIGATKDARKYDNAEQFSRLISGFADELSSNLIPANVKWLEQAKAGSEKKTPAEMAKLVRCKFPAPSNCN